MSVKMDIVERLQDIAAMDLRTGGFLAHTMDTAALAADEIERLRAAKSAALKLADERALETVTLRSEIERLRRSLKDIIDGNTGECACADTARAVLEAAGVRVRR